MSRHGLRAAVLGALEVSQAPAAGAQDLITVPFLKAAPVLDGRIEAEEWRFAAATTGFVNYHVDRLVDAQPVLYLGYDEERLYLALVSRGGPLRAQCITADSPEICADDAVELMVAPGQGADFKRPEFVVYQAIVNSIGTLFDTYHLHNRAEKHPEWSLGGQIAQSAEGDLWTVEMGIPFAVFGTARPSSGTVWSLNIARICGAWIALKSASSAFYYPEGGTPIRFDDTAPAVRLLSLDPIMQGKAGLCLEVANGTDKAMEASADFRLEAAGAYADNESVRVEPGQMAKVCLGDEAVHGRSYAILRCGVEKPGGGPYFRQTRNIHYPLAAVPRRSEAGDGTGQLFYFYPRYYPSLDRLVIDSNFSRFSMKDAVTTVAVSVCSDKEMTREVLALAESAKRDFASVMRRDVGKLADGRYYVRGKLLDAESAVIAAVDDRFLKTRPEWLIHRRGVSDQVIPPFTPLRTRRKDVHCWGRQYRFGDDGLLEQLVTANAQILAGPVTLAAVVAGEGVAWKVTKRFRFGRVAEHLVTFTSAMTGAGLGVSLEGTVEYDGLIRMRLTYGPGRGERPLLDSLQLRLPIRRENASLYIAHPDSVYGLRCGEFRQGNGIVFNSRDDLRNQKIIGTFVPYFWAGDMDRGFCWAAESDEGWLTDDARACLEVERRDQDVILKLNFVNHPTLIDKTRTIAYGLQASPVKPVDNKWRGVWGEGLFQKGEVPVVFRLLGGNPPGATSMNWTRPDPDPRQQERGYTRLWGDGFRLDPHGLDVVSAYYSWWGLARGEIGALRGEWVPDKAHWEIPAYDWSQDPKRGIETNHWGPCAWGKDPENYRWVGDLTYPPSFVDFQVWSFEEAVKVWNISGFYDDCGYMRPVYDEDLGLGYVRDDGRKQACVPIFSVYRDKWKRCACVLDSLGRDNYLCPWSNYNALPVAAWGGALVVGEQEILLARTDDFVDQFLSLPRFSTLFVGRQFGLPCLSCQNTGKAREKGQGRQAMMLYCLHDINPLWVPGENRDEYAGPARGKVRFKPWEPDVAFHGYWQADEALSVEGDGIRVSYYTAGDRAMFIAGNLSRAESTAGLRPDWAKLGVAPDSFCDAETGEPVEIVDGVIQVTVPPRDVRLIMARQHGSGTAPPEEGSRGVKERAAPPAQGRQPDR